MERLASVQHWNPQEKALCARGHGPPARGHGPPGLGEHDPPGAPETVNFMRDVCHMIRIIVAGLKTGFFCLANIEQQGKQQRER
jgi:hypothetical protein